MNKEEKFGREGLTFDDVLLIPSRSDVLPTQVSTKSFLTRSIELELPILSAAMDTVTEAPMAIALGELGGLGVIHRNLAVDAQVAEVQKAKAAGVRVGAAVGVAGDADERVAALVAAGCDLIVVDTAHGHSASVIRMVEKIKVRHRVQVMAGNVATAEGTEELISAGADAVKVGMGPGAICTTRIVAGAGMPQITAVFDCAEAAAKAGIPICADGGIQHSGDIAKAIGAGAHTVMLGGLLAGVDESPGEVVITSEGRMKTYRGMGSMGAMAARGKAGRASGAAAPSGGAGGDRRAEGSAGSGPGHGRDRYGQQDVGEFSKLVPEGVEGLVPSQGPLAPLVHQLAGGLRAGMGYVGAASIEDLRTKARFIRISGAGLRESHPHSVRITTEPPNYRIRA